MRIQLIKSKKEPHRSSTILNIIQDTLKEHGYSIEEVNHVKCFLKVIVERGTICPR